MPTYVDSELLLDAYLAGFFDGEGCIALAGGSDQRVTRYVRINIAQKCLPLLEVIQKRFGGKISKANGCYSLFFYKGEEIVRLLKAMLPHLVLRLKEASIALLIAEATKSGKGHPQLTAFEQLYRLKLEELLEAAAKERKEILCE